MDRWTWRVGGSLALALLWLSSRQPPPPVAAAPVVPQRETAAAVAALTSSNAVFEVVIDLDPDALPFAKRGGAWMSWPYDRRRKQPAPPEDDAPRMWLALVQTVDWSACEAAPWVPDAVEAALTRGTFFLWSLTDKPFGATPECVREPALQAFLEVARVEGYVPLSPEVLADPTRAAVAASIAAWRADLAHQEFRRAWLQRFDPDADLDTVEGYQRVIALAQGQRSPTPPVPDAAHDLVAVRERWGDHPTGQLAWYGLQRERHHRLGTTPDRGDVLAAMARTTDPNLTMRLMAAATGWDRDATPAEARFLEERLRGEDDWEATSGWRFLLGSAVRRGDLAEVDRLHALMGPETEANVHPSSRSWWRAKQRALHVWRVAHGARPDDWLAAAHAALWRCADRFLLQDEGESAFVHDRWDAPADCTLPTSPSPPDGARVRWRLTGAGDPVVAGAAVSGASPTRR